MTPKKLLLINSALNYGSHGHICEELGATAMNDGWDVYIAHGVKYTNPGSLKHYAVGSHAGELMHTFGSLVFDAHGLWSSTETRSLVKWIESIAPDVIHLHNLHGYYLNYEILFEFLSQYNKPVIWTLHDFWPLTGHCAHFDYAGCDKWKTMCANCPQTATYPRALFDKSARNFLRKKIAFTSVKNMTVVPVSNWAASLIKSSFLSKYPIHTIYNGVDVNTFKPNPGHVKTRLGLKDKFVMLGVASPWSKMKGLYDFYALNEILPDDCKIILIGLTQSQIKKLPEGIIGISKTSDRTELTKYYSDADVVLNLSYQETFGLTAVEAMACGTPVIVYNRTASPELVSNTTGFVVEAGNIQAVLNACKTIRDFGKDYFTDSCLNRVSAHFNKSSQTRKYIQLYNSLLNNSI